jgi:hypothetical protein
MLCDYHVIFFLNCNFILKKTKSNIAVLNLEVMKPNKKKEFNWIEIIIIIIIIISYYKWVKNWKEEKII